MEIEVYTDIKHSIKQLLHLNLDSYKDEQMRRRLDTWLVRAGVSSWEEYFIRLRKDSSERSRFRDYLTINVSAFFRDPERWQYLKDNILPVLLKEALQIRPNNTGLQVWSAGCSIGAEPYTMAMILDEVSPMRKHAIMATDFDRSALMKAQNGGPYNQDEIKNLDQAQRGTYIRPGGPPYFVHKNLGRKINFQEHNLLADPFPTGMDLIICRNVVIYLTNDAKDLLYKKLINALRLGGILFIGATEIIPRPKEIGLRSVGISYYQKM
jgi:chemotaxis protein methyltransferase CheR